MRIHLLIGLPGCGKTTLGRELQAADPDLVFLDDATKDSPWPDTEVASLVIASPNFCREPVRANALKWLTAKYPGATFAFTYFAPDLAACQHNVLSRADGRDVAPTLRLLSRAYDIPRNALLRPVISASPTKLIVR